MKASIFAALGLSLAMGFASAKTMVYCSEGSPETFNPQLATSGTSFDASSRQVYNRLYEFRLGTTELVPGLAESVEISEDGTQYTFKLRKGVKYHTTKFFTPTRDFNADDVVFTFNRQLLADHPFAKVSGGVYKYFGDMGMPDLLKKVEKIDDYTVRFELAHAEAPFLANMAMDFASILSAEYADVMQKAGTPELVDQLPIGTGPFRFKQYKQDDSIRYEAHDEYFRGKEKIDQLVFAIVVDPSVRLAKLRKGECHVMSYPVPSQIESIKEDKNMVLKEQPGLNIGYWAFNVTHKPFDDKRVRKALNHAINRQAIMDAIFKGTGQIAKNFIPPIMWSYHDGIVDYDYNPEKAKALLKEAGLEKGFSMTLWAMPVQRPYNPDAKKMAEIMQENLKAIGVTAEVVTYEWGTYLEKARQAEHDTVLIGWTGDNGDPDNFFTPLLSCAAAVTGGNFSRWCNKEFDAAISKARITSDVAERTILYRKAQEIFKDDAPVLTIAHAVRFQANRANVTGLVVDPLGGIYFSGVDLEGPPTP